MPGAPIEFGPADIEAAAAFINELPQSYDRVYVEVWADDSWTLAYGDERERAPRMLASVTQGRRFRIRGVRLS